MLTTWPVIELSETPASFSSTGFRPRASMMDSLTAVSPDPGPVAPEQVPAAWLTTRRLRAFDATGSLTFFDLESPVTHTYLTLYAAPVLQGQGFENLDVAAVRGPSRLLTRAIANWFYSRTDKRRQPRTDSRKWQFCLLLR